MFYWSQYVTVNFTYKRITCEYNMAKYSSLLYRYVYAVRFGLHFLTFTIKARRFFETSETITPTTYHIPEDLKLH